MSDMSYTDTQLRAAAWSNKVTAAISFFSSSYLMYDILKDRGLICCCKRRQQSDTTPKLLTTMQKILLGMCLLDLIADIWFFVGGWAMPNDGETLYSGVATLSPRGTTASCTAQGFFLMLGLAIPLYQVSLTSFYYLTVCKNWKEDRQFRRYQPLFHIPPWCWGLGCALYGAIDDQFHPNLVWCFYGGTDISTELLFGLFYAPLWLSFLISGILLLLIWKKVREQEARIAKYTFVKRISMRITGKQNNDTENNGNTNNRQVVTSTERKYSQQILFQALFYAGSMIITFIFPTGKKFHTLCNTVHIFCHLRL